MKGQSSPLRPTQAPQEMGLGYEHPHRVSSQEGRGCRTQVTAIGYSADGLWL
jgi:hypothetical protein